jgi:hypothetical protein
MALIHRAQLQPSKLELIEPWLRARVWFVGDFSAALTSVVAYRFDDPEGEVGIETLLLRSGDGPVLQVPLTYRGAPLDGADDRLIGTMQHSVLGRRWVYDATGDPAYIAALATAAFRGGVQADEYVDVDGESVFRESTARVYGSGAAGGTVAVPPSPADVSTTEEPGATLVEAVVGGLGRSGRVRLLVVRAPDTSEARAIVSTAVSTAPDDSVTERLSGIWAGQPEPRVLALAFGL